MNFKEIKELIEIVASEASLDELEVERSGVRVRIKRAGPTAADPGPGRSNSGSNDVVTVATSEPSAPAPAPSSAGEGSGDEPGLVYVTSPIVGTFYRSPRPDADPFVGVGDAVEKGSIVCIIEAMKLMNEIEAEVSGEVVSVFVENGHPVEYGERLFAIRPL